MKLPCRGLRAGALVVGAFLSLQSGQASDASLAQQAQAILKANCFRCHGEGSNAKGGFGYVLDRDQLVARGKIVPGKSAESELFHKVSKGEMPPADQKVRPSPAEVALLAKWIDAGAPAATSPSTRSFLTSKYVNEHINADLQTIDPRHYQYLRYFTLTHLYNAGRSEEELDTCRQAVAKLLNSLSWHPRATVPKALDPAKTILRLDLRDYQWSQRSWERLVTAYPYRQPGEGVVNDTFILLRADWFVATASRAPLYYDLLQIPSTDRELERQLRVDVLLNLQEETAVRAGFNDSGVSKNNRLLERHYAAHGAYWRSYDFSDNLGRQNLFDRPLGPVPGQTSFQHAGGEIIFNLPNGLQGYLLVDSNGRRIERAPVEIVSDPKRPDRIVEAGLSCMSCHVRGIIPKADQVRAHVLKNEQSFPRADVQTIKALYAPEAKMKALMEADSDHFVQALKKVGVSPESPEPIETTTLRYEGTMDLPLASGELGLSPEEFSARLKKVPTLLRALGPLQVKGGTVQRQAYLAALPEILREFRLDYDQPVLRKPINTYVEQDPFLGHTGSILCLAFSSDGKHALSGGDDRTVRLWKATGGKSLLVLRGHNDIVTAVAFSPDGRMLVSASKDRTIRLWDAQDGTELHRFTGHTDTISSLVIAADGKQLLSASHDGTLRLWDLVRGMELRTLAGHTGKVASGVISPDGKLGLSGGFDRTVRIWELSSGKELARFEGHTREVHSVAFSPDGQYALSGGGDRIVRLWDVNKRSEVRRWEGHVNAVIRVAFTPDGKRVLSASSQYQTPDRTLRVWDRASGRELYGVGGAESDRVSCATFSSDGRLALVGNLDGALKLWELSK